jgi:RNA polymerase sigma factor (sigma-70 family)
VSLDLDSFYRTHHANAVRWAVALVGRRDIAEEIAQEALVAVGQRLQSIAEPEAYLRRTIVNRATSFHRSTARSLRRDTKAAAAQPTTTYTEPTVEVLDALSRLSHSQRAALSLRYWADWTDEQIADALGCAPSTVRTHLHRGLEALRKELTA